MSKHIKKISANIPRELLSEACKTMQLGQTETIVAGLKEIIAASKRKQLIDLKGKIKIDLDIDKFRGRTRL